VLDVLVFPRFGLVADQARPLAPVIRHAVESLPR
jgi:hypothetical protein